MNRRIAIALMAFACVGFAQTASKRIAAKSVIWAPPNIGWPKESVPQASVPMEMIGRLRVGKIPIILEKTELGNVQRRLGGTLGSQGDAGDALGWLCLHGRDATGPWIFWLFSNEIDGPTIGGFQWMRLAPNEIPDRRCRQLRDGDAAIELPLALRLDMTEAQMRGVLGHPTFVLGGTLFVCHGHQEIIDKVTYDASNNVAVVLRNGTVWTIEVVKTTSN